MKLNKYIFPTILIITLIIYLLNLGVFPIFADEAIYLRWAKRIAQGDENTFISLYDGKPPLFIWLASLGLLIIKNQLFWGRLVSVLSLIFTQIFVFKFLQKNKLKSWGLLAIILIGLNPFVFFHSRLALMDCLLASLILLAVFYWSFNQGKFRGVLTGLFLGLAFWTKTPAMFLLPFPFIDWLFFDRQKKTFIQAILAGLIFSLMFFSLRISIWFPFLFTRSTDFTYQVSDILSGQKIPIFDNLKNLFSWLIAYKNLPLMILSLTSVIIGFIKKQKLIQVITISLLLFILPFIILGKVLAPRYYLYFGFGLSVLSAYSLSLIKGKIKFLLIISIIIYFLPFIYTLILKPLEIKLPQNDQYQYLMEWSSGIGIKEAAQFFNKQKQTKNIKILTEGYFGTLPDGLFVLWPNDFENIEIVGVGSIDSPTAESEIAKATAEEIYFVGNLNRIDIKSQEKFAKITQYNKVEDGSPLVIYRIK